MAAILFFVGVGLLAVAIFHFRPLLGMVALFFMAVLYLLSPSYPLAIPESHTVLSTKLSPNGQSIAEVVQSGADDFPHFFFVVRKISPDGIKPVVAELAAEWFRVIFDWKDDNHLEINGAGVDWVDRRGLPTRAGDIHITYTDFNIYDASYQAREAITERAPEKVPVSPDRVTANFSEAVETGSFAPLMGSAQPNTCNLSIEAEGGIDFDKIGLVVRGSHERKINAYEFSLGARVDGAYQPSIVDAFIVGAAATIARGVGENQLHAISWVGEGDELPKILPFLKYRPIQVVYRTGMGDQFYIYELHTDHVHESLDRFRRCIGYE